LNHHSGQQDIQDIQNIQDTQDIQLISKGNEVGKEGQAELKKASRVDKA